MISKKFTVILALMAGVLFSGLHLKANPVYEDNQKSAGKNSVDAPNSSITLSSFSVPAGRDRLLVVGVVNFANQQTASVTFGTGSSNGMTLQESVDFGAAQLSVFTKVLGSGEAVSGDIVASAGAGAFFSSIGAQSFNNIDQVSPFDGITSNTSTASSASLSVTSAVNDMVCDIIAVNSGGSQTNISSAVQQSATFNDNTGNHNNAQQYISLASSLRQGASSTDMDWTFTSSYNFGHVGLNLNYANLGAISLYDDNGSSAAKNSVDAPNSSITKTNYTVPAGDDRLLTVAVVNFANQQTAGVTFGTGSDNAMTLAKSVDFGPAQLSVFVKPLGSGDAMTGDIVASAGAGAFFSSLTAQSFHGIDQNNPYDGLASNSGESTSAAATVLSEIDDLVCDFIAVNSGSASTNIGAFANQTITDLDNTGNHNNGQQYVALGSSIQNGTGSVDMNWAFPASYEFAHVGINLNYIAPGALALYDENGSSASKNSVDAPNSSITKSGFTVPAGDDRLLTVAVVNFANQQTVNVSFGTNTMTLVESVDFDPAQISVFALTLGSGDAITADIVASAGAGAFFSSLGAQSFHGIDQTTPYDNLTSNTSKSTSSSRSVTSEMHDLVCDFIAVNSGGAKTDISAAVGQKTTFNDNEGNHNNGQQYVSLASSIERGASSVDVDWSFPSSFDYAHVAMNLNYVPQGALALYDFNEETSTKNSVDAPNSSITRSGFTVPAGDDRLLTVAVVNFANQQTVGVTFGTSTMTLVESVDFDPAQISVFALTLGSGNAITGDIVASAGAGAFFSSLGAQSFHDIDQTTPYDNLSSSTLNSVFSSLSVTSETDDLVCDFIAVNSGEAKADIKANANQKTTFNDNEGNHNNGQQYVSLASSLRDGSTSVDMDWSFPGAFDFAHVGMNLNRASDGPTTISISVPVSLTGFNQDVIAEGDGNAAADVTTTTFDNPGGVGSDHVFYNKDFRYGSAGGDFGLANDGIIESAANSKISYQLQDYDQKNVLLLTGDDEGELVLEKASVFDKLFILSASAQGTSEFTVTVTYSDNTTETESFEVDDWFDGDNPAISGFGRVTRTGDDYDDTGNNPRLYDSELAVNPSKVVTKLKFSKVNSSSRTGIFAVCGSIALGTPDAPVATAATDVVNAKSFTANWESVNNVDDYYIDVATDENFANLLADYTNKNVGNVTSLNINTTESVVYYRVRANNQVGQSNSSNTIVVDMTSSIGTQPLTEVSLYPNPGNGQVTINSTKAVIENLVVRNTSGKTVYAANNLGNNQTIDLSHLTPGVYQIEFNAEGQIGVARYIKF